MKKLTLLFAILFVVKFASAQEEAVLRHYMFNQVLINPAATGFDTEHHNLFMNIRSAWSNFPGAPRTYALSYNGAFGKRLGLGALIYTENIASITFYRLQGSYAFRYDFDQLKLSAGFSTQFLRMRLNNDELQNPLYEPGDIRIEEGMDGERIFDATLGVYGELNERLFFGLSLPGLIRTRLGEIEGDPDEGFSFIAQVGGRFDVADYKVKLEPSLVVKKVYTAPFLTDFNLISKFMQDRLIAGLSYEHGAGGALGVILGTKYNSFRFIYTYDIYMDEFQRYNGGTHEITINFEFDRKKDKDGKFDRSRKYRK